MNRERIVNDAVAAGLTIDHVGYGCVSGTAGNWRLKCYGGFWVATPMLGWGMPIAHAVYLHELPMPGAAWGLSPQIAGQVIRVAGSAGAPHPLVWVESCRYVAGTITNYHIDTVAGLRVFVDYVKRPGLSDAVIQSQCPYRMEDTVADG